MNDLWLPMRESFDASARAALIAAAADTWRGAGRQDATAESSRVLRSSGKSASYGELACARRAVGRAQRNVSLKRSGGLQIDRQTRAPPRQRLQTEWLGGFQHRCASAGACSYASVRMYPALGGKINLRFRCRGCPIPAPESGKIIAVEPYAGGLASYGSGTGGVAVIADTPFHAMRALDKVTVEWDHGPAADLSSRDVIEALSHAIDNNKGKAHYEHGDVEAALKSMGKTAIAAEYRAPFLAHATMEPMNTTVQFKDGAATIWAPAQGPAFTVNAVAKVLGINADKVKLVIPFSAAASVGAPLST